MTIYEKLFGTPERAAEMLDGADQIDMCDWMTTVSGVSYSPDKCKLCRFDYDRYGCGWKDMTLFEWLMQEVVE